MGAMDKIKDKAQATKGEAKVETGRAAGNPRLETEGQVDKTAGNLKQAGEKVKDAFRK
jgi:uncharacterized protein YjbJ (UPF0337 family)